MGKASTANMKFFQLAFTLLMLSLHGGKADKVASCLQCQSSPDQENSECIKGTVKGTECGMEMDGCFVNMQSINGQKGEAWVRGCCTANDLCKDLHQDVEEDDETFGGRIDQSWCNTNDCNIGDPRSKANAMVPALTILLATVAVMA